MRGRLFLFAAAIVFVMGASQSPARALDAADPASLINSLVSEAIAEIKAPQESDEVRAAKFRALLEAGFDIPRISRFVLGRFWNGASAEERQKFATLFEDWIVGTYGARFRSYSGQTIKVTGTRKESDSAYKVIDVSVEGISMALTQRDEIAAVADRNGGTAAGLNKAMEQRLAQK
jgi:phospholipid transport system substrate-binding protein